MKMTFDEALQALNDERHIRAADVRADALRRKVWIAEWHIPGCLSESDSVCLTRNDAISAALDMASDENGPPRGMRADLRRYGRSERTAPGAYVRRAITTVTQVTLGEII